MKYNFVIYYTDAGQSFQNYHDYNSIGQAISMAKSVIHNDIAKGKYSADGKIKISVFGSDGRRYYKELFNRAKEV